jgi:hypothetical protein
VRRDRSEANHLPPSRRGDFVEEGNDDAENGVTEAADVQDVVAFQGLCRRGRLQVDADQLRLGV